MSTINQSSPAEIAAPNALPLSVQRIAALASSGLSAALMCSWSAFSNTKSAVLPVRSRQISTGICSEDDPRFDALLPR